MREDLFFFLHLSDDRICSLQHKKKNYKNLLALNKQTKKNKQKLDNIVCLNCLCCFLSSPIIIYFDPCSWHAQVSVIKVHSEQSSLSVRCNVIAVWQPKKDKNRIIKKKIKGKKSKRGVDTCIIGFEISIKLCKCCCCCLSIFCFPCWRTFLLFHIVWREKCRKS